jgi:EmrB/QacA subfamily drug resistance transporter
MNDVGKAPNTSATKKLDKPLTTGRERTQILVGLLLALLLAALDQTIVSTAGPSIQQDLGIPATLYTWLTIGYLITSTVSLPIYGKLGDLHGRKPMILFGIGLFMLGSLLCGLAWNAWSLIIFRALQGLGAGALISASSAVVADLYPPAERGRINGLLGAVFGFSSVFGPLAGGVLTDMLSWHWVFYVNIPIGVVATWFIATRLPALRFGSAKGGVDYLGAVFLVVSTVALLLALSLGKSNPLPGELGFAWTSTPILAMFVVFAVGLVAFLIAESKVKDPLLDLRLFRNRTFSLGTLAIFILGAAFLTTGVFLPQFMINVVGTSATTSGLSTTPLMMGVIGSSIVSGLLTTRFGTYKPVMLVGLTVLLVGFVILGFTLTTDSTTLEVSLKMVVVGIGLGPVVSLYALAVQNALPPTQTGVATSSVSFFQQLGSTVGLAVLGGVFATILTANLAPALATTDPPPALSEQAVSSALPTAPPTPVYKEAYTVAIKTMFRIGSFIVLAGAVVTAFLPALPLRRSTGAEATPALH